MSARRTDAVLALALGLAFSPGLFDLVRHWALAPWSRYSAVFVALTVWLALRLPRPAARPAAGVAVGVAAVGLQLVAMLAGAPALARPAVVLAGVGLVVGRGLASARIAWLAPWIVPVPYQLTDWTGGDRIAPELFRAMARCLRVFGVGVAAGERRVVAGDAWLLLDSTQAGLPVLVAAAGLSVYAALRLRPGRAGFAWGACLLLAAGAASQLLAVGLACLALATGSAKLAGFAVDSLSWMLPSLAAVVVVERRAARRAFAAREEPGSYQPP